MAECISMLQPEQAVDALVAPWLWQNLLFPVQLYWFVAVFISRPQHKHPVIFGAPGKTAFVILS